jgi:hypothetical protein
MTACKTGNLPFLTLALLYGFQSPFNGMQVLEATVLVLLKETDEENVIFL